MGGKGGGDTQSTVTQTNIPDWAQPYVENVLQRGQEESNRPYQPYQGQRIASRDANTTAGLNAYQNFGNSQMTDLANARSLNQRVGDAAMGYQNYQAGGVNNTYAGPEAYTPGTFNADQAEAERVGTGTFGAAERDQYMSPYMDAVVSASQADAQSKALQEQAAIKAQQGTTGAFGGSRGAVQQQLAANDAQKRIADIGVQGRQSAFENAQAQFERDQARGLTASTANQTAALQAALANQKANLEALGMGESSRQYGATLADTGRQRAAELGMTAQSETEKLRQSGKQLGLQGLELASGSANNAANYQGLQDQGTLDRAGALMGAGNYVQTEQQQQLDQAYQDYLNQQNYPLQRLGIIPGLLNSTAGTTQGSGTTSTTTPSNPAQGLMGTALAYDAMQRLGRGTQ